MRVIVASLLSLSLLSSASAADDDVAVMLDGNRVVQKVKAITAEGKVLFDGDAEAVDLQGLRRVEHKVEPVAFAAAARVYLSGGGMLRAAAVTLNEKECTLRWAHGDLVLPMSAIRGIRLNDEADARKFPPGGDAFEADVAGAVTDKDRLYVAIEGKVQSLEGIFLDLNDAQLKFQYENAERTVDRAKVYALTLAGTGKRPEVMGHALVRIADGSSLWAKIVKMEEGQLAMKTLSGQDVAVPWAAVPRVDVRSDRMVFLSDVDPSETYEKAIAYVGPWQRDRSVRGRPLKIGGRVFDKGLGVHATSRLTYAVDPRFTSFAATIGIDEETKGKGDCEFVVLGDGKELLKRRIQGGDGAIDIRVKIAGVKKLTLAVEAGEDLDFADHGDWGDARLIKE